MWSRTLSELIGSPINQQRPCDLELLSELMDSLMTHKLSGFLGVSKSTSLLVMASHWPHNLWLQSTYLAMISGYQAAIIWCKTFWIEGVLRGWHSDYIHMKHSMWKVYLGWVSQSIFSCTHLDTILTKRTCAMPDTKNHSKTLFRCDQTTTLQLILMMSKVVETPLYPSKTTLSWTV